MQLIRSFTPAGHPSGQPAGQAAGQALADTHRGSVVALGNFDGVHRGHQAVLAEAKAIAAAHGVPFSVLTFTPHPREFFQPELRPLHIEPLRDKLAHFAELGVDTVFLQRFGTAFSRLSADQFIQSVLKDRLAVRHVVTGDNFTFGHARSGNRDSLEQAAGAGHFGYSAVAGIQAIAHSSLETRGQTIISSSRIRHCLQEGDTATASLLLGRPYTVSGHVLHGHKRGREIGFPTMNLSLARQFRPRYGVYAVRITLANGRKMDGVANLGIRPTLEGSAPLLEAHAFAEIGQVYGQRVRVEPIGFIRPEQRFADFSALRAQIIRDCEHARAMLASSPPPQEMPSCVFAPPTA